MMFTPFEELEYLAEYLPDEGETVLVTRRGGELVCEPYQRDAAKPVISDTAFYGRLVQANERLAAAAMLPVCSTVLLTFGACVAVHKLTGIGWNGWFLDVGLTLVAFVACGVWIRIRRVRLFQTAIRGMLSRQLRITRGNSYTLLGEMRPHPELTTLAKELYRWIDD